MCSIDCLRSSLRVIMEPVWVTHITVCVVFLVVWKVLCLMDDTQPMVDSLMTVPAIAAQTLYMLRYREQGIYWLIIDVASIMMWSIAENWCVVAQYVFWTLNCVYGYYLWSVKKD